MKLTFTTKIVLLIALLLFVGVVGWQYVKAEDTLGSACPMGGDCGAAQTSDEDTDFESAGPGGLEGSQSQQQGQLEQDRQKAAEQCQAQQNGLGGIMKQAGSLSQTISQALSGSMGKMMNNLSSKIPSMIQSQLTNRLPGLIQSNLSRQLPGMVNSRIGQMQRSGMTDDAIKQLIPQLLTQAIQQITTQTVQQETPRIIENGLQEELPPELVQQINDQIPGIIRDSQFADQVGGMTGEVAQGLGSTQGMTIDGGQQGGLTNGLIDGSILAAQNGVNNSSAVIDLSNQVSSRITDNIVPLLLQNLMPQITQMFAGGAGGSGSISGMFDSSLSFAGLNITGQNFDLSQGLSGDLFNPVVDSIKGPIADQVSIGIGSFQASSMELFGAGDASLMFSESDLLGGGTLTAATEGISGDAIGAISSGAPGIAQGAMGGMSFSGIGNSLKSGLANGLAGGLGGLAGNIPFVGGLVAPIVEQVVAQATIQMLGGLITTMPGMGWPVSDIGTAETISNAVSKGTEATTKAVGENTKVANEVEANTKQTEANTADIKSYAQQTCNWEKKIYTEQQKLVDATYKYGPDATAAALRAAREAANATAKRNATGHAVSPGAVGVQPNNTEGQSQEGQPAVANVKTEADMAQQEAAAKVQTQSVTKSSGNFQADAVIKAHQKITKSSFQDKFKSVISKEDFEALSDPGKLENMSSQEFWTLRKNGIFDDFDSTFLAYDNEVAAKAGEAKELAIAKYVAGQGWNDIRECTQWMPMEEPGSAASTLGINLPGSEPVSVSTGAGGQQQLWCWNWVTKTPASSVKAQADIMANAEMGFLQNAKGIQDDAVNTVAGDMLRRTADMSRAPAQYETQESADPCPGTDPCPNTGWKANQVPSLSDAFNQGLGYGLSNVGSTISNWLDSSMNNYANNAFNSNSTNYGSNSYSSNNFDIGQFSGIFSNFSLSDFINEVPEQVEIVVTETRIDDTHTKIFWEAPAASICQAGNTWAGTTDPAIDDGDYLQTTGEKSVVTDLNNPDYKISCYNSSNSDQKTITIVNQ